MKLLCDRVPSLPPLAWCATIEAGTVTLVHGPWVETGESAFVEGAWDGPFSEWAFADAAAFAGTGARVVPHGVLFASPSHVLEHLFIVTVDKQVVISNSLAFLLVKTVDDLSPAYRHVTRDMLNALAADSQVKQIKLPTAKGRIVHLCTYCNIFVSEELRWHRLTKSTLPVPATFEAYRATLKDVIARIVANAADTTRQHPFEPLATVSSGYDSPACAVLAAEAGCREAVTFTNSKEECEGGSNDSGAEIARMLGMKVHEFDRTTYMTMANMPEAEFAASGGLHDSIMAPVCDTFAKRLVFIGTYGDTVWSPEPRLITPDLRVGLFGGASWTEFRLRSGFFHFVPPFIGAKNHAAIQAITRSQEMKPWHVPGWYNRPIPRRILEEAGIPRGSFAVGKKAIVVDQVRSTSLSEVLTPASLESFLRFQSQLPAMQRLGYRLQRVRFAFGRRWGSCKVAMWRMLDRLCRNKPLLWRLHQKWEMPQRAMQMFNPRRYLLPRPPADELVRWGLSLMHKRYAEALADKSRG